MKTLILIGKVMGVLFSYWLSLYIFGIGFQMLGQKSDFSVVVGLFITLGFLATFIVTIKKQFNYIEKLLKQIL